MSTHNTIMICSIHKDDTDAILKERMIKIEAILAANSYKSGFLLTISGYETDSRELWEIPEVEILATRLANIGFISLLEISAHAKSIKDPSEPIYKQSLGAIELWAISQGILSSKYIITKNQNALFLDQLHDANIACAKVTGWRSK